MKIDVQVVDQGAPVLHEAWVYRQSRTAVAITLEMHTKYAGVSMWSGHTVYLAADDHATNTHPTKPRYSHTELRVTGMPVGFNLFAASGGRYEINLVFIRDHRPWERFIWDVRDVFREACGRLWRALKGRFTHAKSQ